MSPTRAPNGTRCTAGFVLTPTSAQMNLSRRRARNYCCAGRQWGRSPGPSRKVPAAVCSQNANRSRTSARAHIIGRWPRPMRRKRNERKDFFGGIKMVLLIINFSPITDLFRLRFSFFLLPLLPTTRAKPSSAMQGRCVPRHLQCPCASIFP